MGVGIKNFTILLALITFTFAGINAQNYVSTNPVSNPSIEQKLFKKLINLPYYGVFDHITFEVNGDTVTLSGKVLSLGTKKDAENVASKVPGVERVINNIENLPSSGSDNTIRRQLLRTIARSPGLVGYLQEPAPSVRLIVDRGQVTLEGYVNNRSTADTMNILANGVEGVFSVTNNLMIGKGQDR